MAGRPIHTRKSVIRCCPELYGPELKALERQKITENLYQVMVQTGDEVLDYQLAVDKFPNSQLIVQEGGDHSFIDFADMLPKITEFLALVNAK